MKYIIINIYVVICIMKYVLYKFCHVTINILFAILAMKITYKVLRMTYYTIKIALQQHLMLFQQLYV